MTVIIFLHAAIWQCSLGKHHHHMYSLWTRFYLRGQLIKHDVYFKHLRHAPFRDKRISGVLRGMNWWSWKPNQDSLDFKLSSSAKMWPRTWHVRASGSLSEASHSHLLVYKICILQLPFTEAGKSACLKEAQNGSHTQGGKSTSVFQ